jgi:transcriptional regulator with XRE-family HTH domain
MIERETKAAESSIESTNGDPSQGLHQGEAPGALPAIGAVLRRLRRQRGWSIRTVADAAGISPSFLGAVERGGSDISVGRLASLAAVFGHDVASLLGYSARQSRPHLIRPEERVQMSRGAGIDFTALRIPGTTLEMMVATLQPHSRFEDVVTHAGTDILFVAEGEMVLVVDDVDYVLKEGDCAVWPSSHAHTVRNDSNRPARAIGLATETVY